ncbi:MAG TPA: sodium/proline symporter [Myxococcota bacterium]|nr:sodium/proline symporter [Myxococcota bacterium]
MQADALPIAASFLFFLSLFAAIGAYSATRARRTSGDYLLASRSVGPWLIALSAVATNNSGFMFIGLIGTTYLAGISAAWIMVGWIGGDWLAWLVVHRRLRERTASAAAETVPSFLALDAQGRRSALLARTAGLLTVIFLGTYAAAQFSAGSKALHVMFGWPHETGAILGAAVVALYCFSGGIRASIWTDAVQSAVMLVSMLLLAGTALDELGGFAPLWRELRSIDPALVQLVPQKEFGFVPYVLGWFGAGLGVVGQPHVMVRAMAIRDPAEIRTARTIYFAWYWMFSAGCILVGLTCRALLEIPAGGNFDQELALPQLALQLLPAVLVGLVLAGLFAATMSTADSQVLSCSASIVHDIVPSARSDPYRLSKLSTLAVSLLALLIALYGSRNVFALVTLAWSLLASSLGPLLVVRVLGARVSASWAMAMMIGGAATALLWRYGLEFGDAVFDVLPGMLGGFALFAASRLFGARETR